MSVRAVHQTMNISKLVSLGFALVPASASWAQPCSPTWEANTPGFNGAVQTLISADLGAGPRLYAGGAFTVDGSKVAVWTGSGWEGVGTGLPNSAVQSLLVFDDGQGPALYATAFTGVFRLQGVTWQRLPDLSGPNLTLSTVDPDGPGPEPVRLCVAGSFSFPFPRTEVGCAYWDGVAWQSVGSGIPATSALSCEVVSAANLDPDGDGPEPSALYVVGAFNSTQFCSIVKWDGSTWSREAAHLTGSSRYAGALAVFDDGTGPALYVSGNFINGNQLIRYRGGTWTAVGNPQYLVSGLGRDGVRGMAVVNDGSGPMLLFGARLWSSASGHMLAWRRGGLAPYSLGVGVFPSISSPVNALVTVRDAAGTYLAVGGWISGVLDAVGQYSPVSYFARLSLCPDICNSDFDHDGDAATDADIEAFFACLAGDCCVTCISADFNGDGDIGNDADIESFFRVLAGGNC